MRSSFLLWTVTAATIMSSGCQRDRITRLAGCTGSGVTRVRGILTVIPGKGGQKNAELLLLTDKQQVETLVRPDDSSRTALINLAGQEVEVGGRISEVESLFPAVQDKSGRKITSFRVLAQQEGDALVQLELKRVRFLDACP